MADEFGGEPIESAEPQAQTDQFGGVPVSAAQGKPDQFGGLPVEQPEPEGPLKTFAREALRSVASLPPTLAGAGLGAAVGTELMPGIGTIGGSLAGAVGGSILGNKFIDWALEKAGLREGTGFLSKAAEEAGQQENPISALGGSLAAAPVGFGAKLPATMSAGQRLFTRGAGVATMGGLDIGQQYVEKGQVDLGEALASAVAGGVFAKPRAVTQRFIAAGERVGKPIGGLFRIGDGEVPPGATPPPTSAPGEERPEIPTESNATDSVPPHISRGTAEVKPPPGAGGETEPKANPTIGNPDSAGIAGKEASPSSTDEKGRRYEKDNVLAERQANTKTISTGLIPDDVLAAVKPEREAAPPPAAPEPERPPNAPLFSPEQQAAAQAAPAETIHAPEPITHPAAQRAIEAARARRASGAAPKPEETKPATQLEPGGKNAELAKQTPKPDEATLERMADEILKRHEDAGGIIPEDREAAKQRVKEAISKPPEVDETRAAELMAERDRLQKELEASDVTGAVTKEPLQFVQKTLDALAKKGTPEAKTLAESIRSMPHEQQAGAAARASGMLASRTGKVPGELKNQRFRNPDVVPKVGNVTFKSKSAAAKATQALQAAETAMAIHAPPENETASQLQRRMREVVAKAAELNGGKSPYESYKPRVKPAELMFVRHAEQIAKRKGVLREGTALHQQAIADEKLIRGTPEDVEAYRANRRGEADIAKSRRSGEEAVAGAEAEQAKQNHTPEAQDALHEDFQKVGENIRKYADAGEVYTKEQRGTEERSVAKPEDVAAFKAKRAGKVATHEDVKTRISRPTLHAVQKAVKDAPEVQKEKTPEEKYEGSCT